jgi:hypothetical protein
MDRGTPKEPADQQDEAAAAQKSQTTGPGIRNERQNTDHSSISQAQDTHDTGLA